MLNMCDPPTHSRIRGLVSRGFTPKGLAPLRPILASRAAVIVDGVLERGGACDFLADVAAELPLQTIAQIMGVPQADRHQLFAWTSAILDFRGRDLAEPSDAVAEAGIGMPRLRRGDRRRERAPGRRTICSRPWSPGDCRTPSSVRSSACSSPQGARRPGTPSRAVSSRCSSGRGSGSGSGPTAPCCRRRSRRSCGGPAPRPTTAAPRPATSSWVDTRSGPARRPPTGIRRRTATRTSSRHRSVSTSAVRRTRTWRSASASTTASERRSPGSRSR